MNGLKPINVEYIRRISVLVLLAISAWLFFYAPSDIFEIQIKNYKELYDVKVRQGIIEPQTTLQLYILQEMQGPYWRSSPVTPQITELKGDSGEFLARMEAENRAGAADHSMQQHHQDGFMARDHYFFKKDELPASLIANALSKDAGFISISDQDGKKTYFQIYPARSNLSLAYAPVFIHYPWRNYAYGLLMLALLIYIVLPKPQKSEESAYYTRFNAVYLSDALGAFLWMGAWMFFFLPDDSAPVFVRYFLLLFFGLFAFIIVWSANKYASSWYLFKDGFFQWSGAGGIHSIALNEIVSVKPYKRKLPKWLAPLIILFGRGQPGATGIGILTGTAEPEMGMEITTKSGRKVKVMANYLEGDEAFTKRFEELERTVQDK